MDLEATPKPALSPYSTAHPLSVPPGVAVSPLLPGRVTLVLFDFLSSSQSLLPPTAEPRIHVNGSQDADEPLRVTAKAGDEVTLDCEAQGSPPPLVTWTKDFRPVPSITNR